VFVPIHDTNPLRRIEFQYVNIALIAINVIVYLLFQLPPELQGDACAGSVMAKMFGVIPMELQGIQVAFEGCADTQAMTAVLPEYATLLSYMFLHGDFLHLLGNMAFLWVFGDNVEDALGHVGYLFFYLLCGVAGALLHATLTMEPTAPLIGASGAVSGVVMAYLLLHPRVHLWVLVLRIIPLRVRAYWALGAWIGLNVSLAVLPLLPMSLPVDPLVAWWAHVGGILAGGLLVLVLRRRGVELFQEPPPEA
jgi:membrane associated rhomboid family serine protease